MAESAEATATELGVDPLTLLWTTPAELAASVALRPNLSVWALIQENFLRDRDAPIPFVEITNHGPWTVLQAMWAPFYAPGRDESTAARTRAILDFLSLLAKAATLAVPIAYKGVHDPPGSWSSAWRLLRHLLGHQAADAIALFWGAVERGEAVHERETWVDQISRAISDDAVRRLTSSLPVGASDLARMIVEAGVGPNPNTVSELLLGLRGLAWRQSILYTVDDPLDYGPASRLYDLSNPNSHPILAAIDDEYENLISGLLTFGGAFVRELEVRPVE